jgi:hypothetical protein
MEGKDGKRCEKGRQDKMEGGERKRRGQGKRWKTIQLIEGEEENKKRKKDR